MHPQHNCSSQRVNSSATPAASATNNKLTSPTTHSTAAATKPQAATTTTTNSANNKLMSCVRVESGKVNSNHKDVNGRETSSGKQDGTKTSGGGRSQLRQMLSGSQKTTTGDQVKNVASNNGSQSNISSSSERKASVRVATKSKNEQSSGERDNLNTDNDDDGSDHSRQFSLCNGNNNNYHDDGDCQQTTATTLSVASENFFTGDDSDDKELHCLLHDKSKQATTRKHSPGHTFFYSPSARPSTANQLHRQQQQDRLSDESGRPLRDNCCSHHQHRSAKSTLTKSTASIGDDTNCPLPTNVGYGVFNHRFPSKPMGQQVLSLMMLDVGLMPSNSNPAQQQPMHKVSSVSHVRIQSPPGCDEGFDDSSGRVFNRHLLQNGHSSHQSDSIDLANIRLKERTTNIPVNEMLRLRLNSLNLDSQRTRSISLPSSPRLKIRQLNQQQPSTMNGLLARHQIEKASGISPRTASAHSPTSRLLNASRYQSGERDYLAFHRPLLTCADRNREDSRSNSSSCSSLNHNYPPLLAISNQLNDLNLQELILQHRTDPTTQDESKQLQQRQKLLLLNTAAIGQTNNNNPTLLVPTVNRTTSAHTSNCPESGTIGSNDDSDEGRISSNCFNACSLNSKPSDTDSGYENIAGDHSPGSIEPTSVHPQDRLNQRIAGSNDGGQGGESCLDPPLR